MIERVARWTLGDIRLTSVVEAQTPVPATLLLPDALPSDVRAAGVDDPDVAASDGSRIGFRVQAFVVESRGRTVLVDPCVGNHKSLTLPMWDHLDLPWLADLRAAGFAPTDIDTVVHTHLHEDHIGWDTQLVQGEWTPVFSNAAHIYVGDELDFTKEPARREAQDPWAESIQPILNAGLSIETAADHDLGDGFRLLATPGHTPGHASLRIENGDTELVISGDVIDHPFQCAYPDLAHGSDWNPLMARETRKNFLDHYSDRDVLVAGTHFPGTPVGRIERSTGAWKFLPVSADRICGSRRRRIIGGKSNAKWSTDPEVD